MKPLRMLIVMSVLTGLLYTMTVTFTGRLAFGWQAGGSLVTCNGHLTGSELLAQKFGNNLYFWPRPSFTDFATTPSGASNKGPTSQDLRRTVAKRTSTLRAANMLSEQEPVASDLLYASGSGLDPHISLQAARLQIRRVAAARGMPEGMLVPLVDQAVEEPQFGFLGETRINVLRLNIMLDELDYARKNKTL